MPVLGAVAGCWLCAWWRLGAGGGCWLARGGSRAGAGCPCWVLVLALRVVEAGCKLANCGQLTFGANMFTQSSINHIHALVPEDDGFRV